jgi:hypothetical protein
MAIGALNDLRTQMTLLCVNWVNYVMTAIG